MRNKQILALFELSFLVICVIGLLVYIPNKNVPIVHATTYTCTLTGNGGFYNILDVTQSRGYSGSSGAALSGINMGDTVRITVTPPSGTTFSEWTVSGSEVSYSNPYTVTWYFDPSATFNAVF